MNSIIQTIGDVIRSWAGGDRIRISPTQGRLLGLQPGDRLVVRNDIYSVRARKKTFDTITYDLNDSQQDCQLVVSIEGTDDSVGTTMTSGQLHRAGSYEMTIFDDDVVLLSTEDSGRC